MYNFDPLSSVSDCTVSLFTDHYVPYIDVRGAVSDKVIRLATRIQCILNLFVSLFVLLTCVYVFRRSQMKNDEMATDWRVLRICLSG